MIDICSLETTRLISVDEALMRLSQRLKSVNGSEKLPLKQALGRILAAPVYAQINLPSYRNSAMDGYAFASSDIQHGVDFTLTLVGTSWAGRPFTGQMNSGECVRVFTGAVLPDQADSVIMQEQVSVSENDIFFPTDCKALQHVRNIGEDVKKGHLLLEAAKKLSAVDLGLLAATGVSEVEVKRKLKIAFFSTGDELVSLGNTLANGQIYDSNRYILHGLLTDSCFDVLDSGVIADDKVLLEKTLVAMAEQVDVIITTGGASVGEADYIKDVLDRCGEVDFWKIAMKPGKPLAFGSINQCVFFGLPGNPVSVVATFDKIVKPALGQLIGATPRKPLQLKAICSSRLKKAAGRQEYQRGILQQNSAGHLTVTSAGQQGSNILTAISRANCYIVLANECEGVVIGEEVTVEPFETWIECLH